MNKKLGISLLGGGARCGVYLGLLKALEERNIIPDYLMGSSAGALIAGSYAAGKSIEELQQDFLEFNYFKLLKKRRILNLKPIDMQKAYNYVFNKIGNIRFEELNIPTIIIATNITLGRAEYIDYGYLANAMVASAAPPFFAEAYSYNGSNYCDGDVSGSYGARALKGKGADIVVSVTNTYENKGAFGQMINLFSKNALGKDYELAPPNLLITLRADIGLTEFKKGAMLMQSGYDQSQKYLDTIEDLLSN